MPIRIYNYEESKLPMAVKLVKDILDKHYINKYYLDTDWHKGPSILIVMSKELENVILEDIKQWVKKYKKMHEIPQNDIEKIKVKYKKHQLKLSQLEMRDNIFENQVMEEDGYVEVVERKTGVYNSEYHRELFARLRYQLQPTYNNLAEILLTLSTEEKTKLFVRQFLFISSLYQDGMEYGYLSFLSHVEGFFSRLRLEGYNINLKEYFENKRKSLLKSNDLKLPGQVEVIMTDWENAWTTINEEMSDNFDIKNFDDSDMLGLDEQFTKFIENISSMDNHFHQLLLKKENIQEFILSEKMLLFRNIINLFYLSLPFFEQSMFNKHFYAYCTSQYMMENHSDRIPLKL